MVLQSLVVQVGAFAHVQLEPALELNSLVVAANDRLAGNDLGDPLGFERRVHFDQEYAERKELNAHHDHEHTHQDRVQGPLCDQVVGAVLKEGFLVLGHTHPHLVSLADNSGQFNCENANAADYLRQAVNSGRESLPVHERPDAVTRRHIEKVENCDIHQREHKVGDTHCVLERDARETGNAIANEPIKVSGKGRGT